MNWEKASKYNDDPKPKEKGAIPLVSFGWVGGGYECDGFLGRGASTVRVEYARVYV